jgi:glycosyltransferase involved in cell wall biosynthesis
MIKVTVYIPTHNRRKLVERAINSVLAQTYQDLEIIVVNDASSDGTMEYLDQVALSEPRLVVIHTRKPLGAGAARNRALEIATGQLLTGLDDDDEFGPTRIADFVSEWTAMGALTDEISCLFTDSLLVDGVRSFVTTDRKEVVSYRELFQHNFIGNQVFCPTKRILEIGGFDEGLPAWEDLDLFIRLLRRYGPARRLSVASYICHIERNRDRISNNAANHHLAFEMISEKTRGLPAQLHQQLFLQLFSPFYGTIPTISDWRRLLVWRAPPTLLARLLRANIRNLIRKDV